MVHGNKEMILIIHLEGNENAMKWDPGIVYIIIANKH